MLWNALSRYHYHHHHHCHHHHRRRRHHHHHHHYHYRRHQHNMNTSHRQHDRVVIHLKSSDNGDGCMGWCSESYIFVRSLIRLFACRCSSLSCLVPCFSARPGLTSRRSRWPKAPPIKYSPSSTGSVQILRSRLVPFVNHPSRFSYERNKSMNDFIPKILKG